MKAITIAFILLISSFTSPAQQFYAGAGLGISDQSRNLIITDSIAMAVTNETGRKYLIPHAGISFKLNSRISLQTELAYRRHTISLQYWDSRSDTCRLCPLKKGGGPSIDEFRLTAKLNWEPGGIFNKWLSLTGGISLALPFSRSGNAKMLADNYRSAAIAGENVQTGPLVYLIGMNLQHDFLTFSVLYNYHSNYTRAVRLQDYMLPFSTTERMWVYRLSIGF